MNRKNFKGKGAIFNPDLIPSIGEGSLQSRLARECGLAAQDERAGYLWISGLHLCRFATRSEDVTKFSISAVSNSNLV